MTIYNFLLAYRGHTFAIDSTYLMAILFHLLCLESLNEIKGRIFQEETFPHCFWCSFLVFIFRSSPSRHFFEWTWWETLKNIPGELCAQYSSVLFKQDTEVVRGNEKWVFIYLNVLSLVFNIMAPHEAPFGVFNDNEIIKRHIFIEQIIPHDNAEWLIESTTRAMS